MKKLFILSLLLTMGLSTFAKSPVQKGDLLVDLGLGVGMLDSKPSKAMFTQRIGAEWVIVPELINDRFALSGGLYVNNGFAKATVPIIIMEGSHYYEDDGDMKRNDLNFMPTMSLRWFCDEKLEFYLSIGVGLGIMHASIHDAPDEDGDYYDDDEIVGAGSSSTAAAAISSYVGARYHINKNWGINTQLGLISANLKKSAGHSFNLFSVGATYFF